ncbi:MAG: translocation/assembly module TamB, partial [Chitinophagaceae bacterium]|nr:translocation/assembly module TamB [Chitinophagaceae bacterium]
REGIVRFVDMDATEEDSLFMAPYDSLKISPLQGFDVTINLNIDKNAIFNIIVDEGNGDFLRLKGIGQLTGGIDPSGKITMVGSYEISEGSYDLSFNFLKRKFLIQKGSKIVWTGEPTTADIDVTAIYIANTAPYDLVRAQNDAVNDTYRQKLPFEVHLTMRGVLLLPVITFDIVLPGDKNYNVEKSILTEVENRLLQMRQEPAEMNKQVFALLLLNRFVAENPFDNTGGGGLDPGSFARQSVSKLLTEQLNQLAGNLIEGVDINFEVASSQDYSTGTRQDRTDFNVGLSKRLLSDRLVVTVGSNFELEGPQQTSGKGQKNNVAGNIAIDYKLSRSGRYMLRAYRKNDYEGAIEGYVIETGLGFIISVDFSRWSQLFNRKKRKAAREERKQAAEDDKQKIDNSVKESGNEISL